MNQNLLVSCIMPTYNRRAFVPEAIEHFLRQDYEPRELLILDDGEDCVADLIPSDPRIRYVRLEHRLTVGVKRNRACELAKGELIAHWDDDDWHAPHRLSYQVRELLAAGAEVCGLQTLLFYDPVRDQAWKYVYPAGQRFWLSGSSLCYFKSFWRRHPFPGVNVGEDSRFVGSGTGERMLALPDFRFHVGFIHADNVSPKRTGGAWWQPFLAEEVRRLMAEAPAVKLHPAVPHHEEGIPMITAARADDLELTEFAAFNHGLSLPRMRRWELPFVLFQARLDNTSALLDCTINPAGFPERLAQLYPHLLYRHWSPIQSGQFSLPAVPDAAFDRVICVNTLEHLLAPQRQALLSAMARKLKPGGRLILTSDFYFDAFWERPELLRMGVMRADRQEVFGGWNKVTVAEWLELTRSSGLEPLGEVSAEPQEGDSGLYRNQEPYPHACIGGVWRKGEEAPPRPRRVVLALLTWNTQTISLESLQAYVREAQMLRRLGQEAMICVCDNGSSDGTAEALRELEGRLPVPHRFILNPQNRGNSIARNQIIAAMLEWGGDYLLFMDGDIEVVAGSSFAMLRHLENQGHTLGCIGADSAWQSPQRGLTTPFLYAVEGMRVEPTNLVAWTQYGMFRREVFEDGVRFDESDPFDQAGWGFEDNDLAFQMEVKGYRNERFLGMTYLHRAARSSIRIMHSQGIDAAGLYARRKQYVIEKWARVPQISQGPLILVRQVQMPSVR
ncbi:MAG TPA: glycosyltransferase [Meiothermus sp.]|nr:glycosyltransferase [Meiothermus sp.]